VQQPSHYRANNIQEFKFKRRAKRLLEKSAIIGQRGAKYTVIGASLIEPTLEYPDTAVSLSLSNGASYTFAQLNPAEFDSLIRTLTDWAMEFGNAYPDLQDKSNAIKAQRAELDAQMAQLEAAQAQVRMMQNAAAQAGFQEPQL